MSRLNVLRQEISRLTSWQALPKANSPSSSKKQKIFWTTLIAAIVIACVVQLAIRILEYSEQRTTTSVSEKYVEELDMPAITFCNFNSFFRVKSKEERDAIYELAIVRNYIEGYPVNVENFKYFENVYNGSIRAYAIDKGWQLHDFLVSCIVGHDLCALEEFSFSLGDMGKCWTYKYRNKIKRVGSRFGVSMILDVNQNGYTESFFNGRLQAGLRVQIHPLYDVPEVDQFGLAVPVGSMAFIGLHKREENIMYKPWGDCEPNKENLILHDTYSEPNCFHDCFQRNAEESCQCQIYYANGSAQYPECTPRKMADCFVNVTAKLKLTLTPKKCGCPPPCKSQHFDSKISYATFPNLEVQKEILNMTNFTEEYLKNNILAFTVYYERMSYSLRKEGKATTWTALISDLGGQLGLWTGLSMVTLCELIHLVVFACFERLSDKRKLDQQAEQQPSGDKVRESLPEAKYMGQQHLGVDEAAGHGTTHAETALHSF